jgi:hypothetical protein
MPVFPPRALHWDHAHDVEPLPEESAAESRIRVPVTQESFFKLDLPCCGIYWWPRTCRYCSLVLAVLAAVVSVALLALTLAIH